MLTSMRMPLAVGLLSATALFGMPKAAVASPEVVDSIKPIHSLVSMVMEGVGEPPLIIDGGSSPHTYSLRPSDAKALQSADIVFWGGEDLETFLEKPLDTLSAEAKKVSLLSTPDVELLPFREGGAFEGHDDHDDHGHKDHADHKDHAHDDHGHKDHADHKDHAHDDHGHKEHADHKDHAHDDHGHDDHAGHEGHHHGEFDPHVWLDPANAVEMIEFIAEELSEVDPANASAYAANAVTAASRVKGLISEISEILEPVHERRFIVFHDAYHYFEERFDLQAAGAIAINPERLPGARRVQEIQEVMTERDVGCVFSEPQFEPKIAELVTQGTQANRAELDPLGAGLTAGSGLYPTLLQAMAKSFRDCLSPKA